MSQPHVLTLERTHYWLTKHVIETGHAPDVLRLAELANCSQQETENSLQALADMHGVILEPNSLRIWSLHPFAMVPSAFSVTSGARGWWANCAWCSLGIGAALGEDFSVLTTDGAEGESLQFDVAGSKSSRAKIVMHFPYPPGRWWDNPYCPKGAILPFQTSMELARLWFGDYAASDWRRKTPQQAMDIFRKLQLDPAFWNIPGTFR